MKKIIPIFYACDDNFVKYTIVSLKSIIENASKEYQYNVYVLNTNISDEMKQKTLELENENFKIIFEDVTSYLNSISDKLPVRHYYSKTTYYRLFIAEMFPEYDKAVYIDSDTVVTGDISEFYNHELGDNYVGACNEQAMVQVQLYGDYAEKVVGIDRNQFFNAGHLLINCDQFRKNKVLDQFFKLLGEYNFIVTQDEDYLNVICDSKVLWIDQAWNTEAFCKVITPEKDIKMIHYIMVSKPWHFKDANLGDYFWKYAKMTNVYDEILDELNNYTDEQRQRDYAIMENLSEMCIAEIEKEDNFIKLKKKLLINQLSA